MKFLHIADLHIGKTIYGASMIDQGDQPDWVEKFLSLCDEEKPDAIVIAGDVYDRSSPSGDAVELLDHLLTELAGRRIPAMLIAGNHDSGQRLSFGHELLAQSGIHIAGTVRKEIEHVVFEDPDGFGPVTFWLVPYLFPEEVSLLLENPEIRTYEQAMRALLAEQNIDFTERNVIVSHQNITENGKEAERGGSETMVGGIGEIDYTVFDGFEYAALGHIHSAYPVGREEVRYAGTPLCYHLEETRQKKKGPVCVELHAKNEPLSISVKTIAPLHFMRFMKGTKDEIYQQLLQDGGRNEYIGITITDQRITPEISAYLTRLLEGRGSLLMELVSEYSSFGNAAASAQAKAVKEKSLEDLFSDLYTEQNGKVPPTDPEYALMQFVGELVRNQDCHQPMDERKTEEILQKAKELGGEGK